MSWETELLSLYTAELRDVMGEVRNSTAIDDSLHLPVKLSTFVDRVHDKFDRRVNYRYIYTVCFDAFFDKGYQTYPENISTCYVSEYMLPTEAIHTTKYIDTVVRYMTNHLQNILDPYTVVLH